MMGLFITVPIVAALIVPDGTETADENVAYITGKSDSIIQQEEVLVLGLILW